MLLILLLACADKGTPSESAPPDTGCPGGGEVARWHEDGDADGHGDPAVFVESCDQPAFWVSAGDDCDDADASAHPGATETCDGVDDDCDSEIDEGLETGTWWDDADGDGFGDPATQTTGCSPPEHPVDNADDCDDADNLTYPGAPETCGDGRYNDCGLVSESCGLSGVVSVAAAAATLYGEAEDARAGQALAGAGDLDGDGALDLLVAAPEDPAGGLSAGAVYLVQGPLAPTMILGESAAKLVGERANAYTGLALAAGDADGDGFPDVLVGAPGVPTSAGQGVVSLVQGPVSGELGLEEADLRYEGPEGSGLLGGALTMADVDGDGDLDLLLADPYGQTDGVAAGWIALVAGPVGADSALEGAPRLWGEDEGDYAGVALAAGTDLDGDGVPDLAVGAAYQGEAGVSAGATYLLYGPLTEERALADADARWLGEDEGDFAGRALCAGDLDGDGLADLAVGGAGSDVAGDGAGAVWLVYGPAGGGGSLSDAEVRWLGELDHDAVGQELAIAGDVDADGRQDLLIGAPGEDSAGAFAGAAYLVLGPAAGGGDLSAARAKILGLDRNDSAGIAVAGPGDVDADGLDDLGVGAYAVDTVADWAGAAYLIPGAGY